MKNQLRSTSQNDLLRSQKNNQTNDVKDGIDNDDNFSSSSPSSKSISSPLFRSDLPNSIDSNSSSNNTKSVISDWTVSGSLVSMLLKKEQMDQEQMRNIEQSNTVKDYSRQISNSNENNITMTPSRRAKRIGVKIIDATLKTGKNSNLKTSDTSGAGDTIRAKDADSKKEEEDNSEHKEVAREVDDSLIYLTGSIDDIMKEITVLDSSSTLQDISADEMKEEIQTLSSTEPASIPQIDETKNLLPLRDPQYLDMIERNIRHLSLSIASTIDGPSQWKAFCEEGGGLLPLLICVRDGAKMIREGKTDSGVDPSGLTSSHEEAFAAACSSCKALRDLCAISKPFAAIVTDGILRADSFLCTATSSNEGSTDYSSSGLLSDFVTLLNYSTDEYKKRSGGKKQRSRRASSTIGLKQRFGTQRQRRRDARRRCGLYVVQLLLEMAFASDAAVNSIRSTAGLTDAVLSSSSYAQAERLRRRFFRYPIELIKRTLPMQQRTVGYSNQRAFLAVASVGSDLNGQIRGAANQVLASIGYNVWYPKAPGQKGLRILCLDGGGTRGITAISSMRAMVDAMGGVEICDSFDLIAGTSTGAIIAFLVGLRRESSMMARKRYDRLIRRIFVKSALSGPMLVFTTATYDETPFNTVIGEILRDNSMLASRADPRVPLVFAISSKMSSTPTQLCLFRNYNYSGGEKYDSFVQDPKEAKLELGIEEYDDIFPMASKLKQNAQPQHNKKDRSFLQDPKASRHPGSFRVLQRAALRATTAAPTVFKPVLMGDELYCDGGIVASNPAAVAIHEARTIFPDIPIEMVVSCGTGAFLEEKSAPRIGWDGIIGQIVNSATDGEQTHHILEDILGQGGTARLGKSSVSKTRYYRFNPIIGTPDSFPIDGTDPEKLEQLSQITMEYMKEPEQARKLQEIVQILNGKTAVQNIFSKVRSVFTIQNMK